jgi:hypothetical protein
MQHERTDARDAEDRFLEDDLAARDRQIGAQPLEKFARFVRVR